MIKSFKEQKNIIENILEKYNFLLNNLIINEKYLTPDEFNEEVKNEILILSQIKIVEYDDRKFEFIYHKDYFLKIEKDVNDENNVKYTLFFRKK